MSDGNDNDGRNDQGGGNPAGGRGPLTLKPRGAVPAGTVRQSFSHGRSKTVVVETKRRRGPDERPAVEARPRPPQAAPTSGAPGGGQRPQPAPSAAPRSGGGGSNLNLSQSELANRQRVLEAAARQAAEARRHVDEPAHAEVQGRAEPAVEARTAEARAPEPRTPEPRTPSAPPPQSSAPDRAEAPPADVRPPPVAATAVASAPSPAPEPQVVAPPAPRPAEAPARGDAPPREPTRAEAAPATPEPPRAWERLGQTRRVDAPREERAPRSDAPRSDAPRPTPPGFGDRSARPAGGGFGPRPAGDRPAGDRPQTARPPGQGYGDRPRDGGSSYGARGPSDRPQNDRFGGDRATSDRGAADRPQGGYGDRPRPQGASPSGSGYGDRSRDGGYGARPAGAGGYGDRPRPQGASPGAGGGYGDRAPRSDAGGYGARSPRPAGAGGGSDTVRYSALAPRPAGPRTSPGGARPGGPRGAPGAPSAPEITKTARSAPPRAGERRPLGGAGEDDDARGARRGAAGKAVSRTKGEPKRREGRLTIQAVAGDGDTAERMRSLASVRRAREREKEKRTKGVGGADQARVAREVVIPDAITVQDLAQRMATRSVDIIKYLMRQGTMLTINDVLDADTAELIASEFGHTVKRVSESDVETGFLAEEDVADDTQPRPPVVTVMGHVDHGKTSLLDALRAADVAGGEAGGITQHIGAYQVRLPNGERVTFLDTPGHAAFSAMRMRGANVTDIVVLVVAADDGVMPQTIEAINHARAAGAPIIVAVNKMDKPDANPTRVINELLQHEVVVESLGGETQLIEVSALKKTGLDQLIEAILLQAEVMDLRANPDRAAEGVIIEAKLDRGRGPVATVLVERGTLKRGDIVVAGQAWGKVRALVNERGEQIPAAGPSEPVEILGLDQAPPPGEPFATVENEARARELTEYRIRQRREKQIGAPTASASLAEMMAKLQNKQVKELALVIKADVQGSAEAIAGSLEKLGNEEVRARIIHSGVGAITESDVQLAKGSGAPIVGFNVRASKQARDLAEREGVEIRYYAIIYDLIDDLKGVLSGMLSPIQRETWLGNATVLEVFNITKVGNVAGCRVTEGVVRRGAKVRVIRDNVVITEMGTLNNLKRFKDDVAEVISGQECGMNYSSQDIKPGDVIECFTVETVARTL
jgi:translation initiation factor IF-2